MVSHANTNRASHAQIKQKSASHFGILKVKVCKRVNSPVFRGSDVWHCEPRTIARAIRVNEIGSFTYIQHVFDILQVYTISGEHNNAS